jgi:hypothetical protein
MTTLECMRVVAHHFNHMECRYAFLGASVLPLHLDHPELFEVRPTKDVDLTIEILTLGEFYKLETRLRSLGFRNDTREEAPICRWIIETVTVDIMPCESSVLGMASAWFPEALGNAVPKDLGQGVSAPVVSPVYFLATKLAAFRDRGMKDMVMSKDLEDILTLVEGCAQLLGETATSAPAVRGFIAAEISTHLGKPDFSESLSAFFRSDSVSQQRLRAVRERLERLAQLGE